MIKGEGKPTSSSVGKPDPHRLGAFLEYIAEVLFKLDQEKQATETKKPAPKERRSKKP